MNCIIKRSRENSLSAAMRNSVLLREEGGGAKTCALAPACCQRKKKQHAESGGRHLGWSHCIGLGAGTLPQPSMRFPLEYSRYVVGARI
ncbi:hypothetical protein Y032_0439g1496 [Ancylostoma ceylanicum]|uniref:Uncharacterized protein n=1 Tax=Ancylostoma ceylanicum TaxID=53326 RepID=A0A016WZ57_9BILA|nr:hypothetical protein Y032_0439g1496 [Ancylostoma ceylanicum]